MTLAVARFVQTGTQRSDATNWLINNNQGWYNAERKTSPLVVHTVSGTPSMSSFQLKGAGSWRIQANGQFAGNSTISICRSGIADSNVMASSGSLLNPNVTLQREFDFNATIQIRWSLVAAGVMQQARDDINWVAFEYLGPL